MSRTDTARRVVLLIFLLPLVMGASFCVRTRAVPEELKTQPPVPLSAMVEKINSYQRQNSLSAQVILQFKDFNRATVGEAKEYPPADGRLFLRRPQKIRLLIQAPITGSNIADMATDGEHFQLALTPPTSPHKFIKGTNNKEYRVDLSEVTDPNLRRAGALANIKPQHFTEALFINPIDKSDPNTIYYLEEHRQIEDDTRPDRKRNAKVERTYYIVVVLEKQNGSARLMRKFWFDRTQPGTPLVRQQTYENGGHLATEIDYRGSLVANGSNEVIAQTITVRRRSDYYAVDVTFKPNTVVINGPLEDKLFILENTQNLEVVDLDKRAAAIQQP